MALRALSAGPDGRCAVGSASAPRFFVGWRRLSYVRVGVAALTALAALSCLSDRTAGPTSDAVGLHLHAIVHGLGGTQTRDPSLRIHVAYQRDSGALIQLPSEPEDVAINPGVTTQPVLVDIAPCLSDPQHAPLGGRGCNLSVAIVLLVDGVVADSEGESANQVAGPGATLDLATITLTVPTAVVLSTHVARVFADGAPLDLTAAVYDSTLLLVGHPVTWTSSAPAVASVTPVGPDSVIVTPLAAGTTVIKASTGGVSDSAFITVIATRGTVVIGLSRTALTDTYALSLGTNPPPSVISVTDSGTAPLTGLSLGAITYSAGATGWLTATLSSSTASTNITVSPTPNTLAVPPRVGTYTASFQVSSPLASNSPRTVVVTLNVTAGPSAIIDLSTAAVTDTFALSLGTNPPRSVINVTDGGALALTGLSLGAVTYQGGSRGWLSAALGATTAPTNITLTVNPAGLPVPPPVGTYTATVTVNSAVASNSPRTVVVTLVVTTGPLATIGLSATGAAERLTLVGNDPPRASIAVTDNGQLPLTGLLATNLVYAPATPGGWLNVSVGADAPTNVTMTPDPVETGQTFLAGTYTATFQLSAPHATNSPRTIVDTMIVTPAVTGLSQAVFYDTVYNQAPSSPPPIVIQAIDSGGAPLTGLTVSAPTYTSPPGVPPGTGWIAGVTVKPTTAPATIVITPVYPPNPSLPFAQGNFTATLQVTSPVAATRTITINLYVSDTGVIF